MRNLMQKLPAEVQAEIKQAARAAYQAPSPAMAQDALSLLRGGTERVPGAPGAACPFARAGGPMGV